MAGHRGITIIIALVLATAITLAVALSAFTFIQKTQSRAQGLTEGGTSLLLQKWSTCAKLVSFKFNPVTNMSEAVLRNCGFRELELGNDSLYTIVKSPAGNCAFSLNSQNCANCVGKLGIGAFVALQINASAVSCSPSTLADLLHAAVGQTVEVVMSGKRAAFITATTFVPEPVVVCGLNLGISSIINSSTSSRISVCYNYSIQNTGNAQDTFALQKEVITNVPDLFVALKQFPDCSGNNITSITLLPNQTTYFGLKVYFNCSDVNKGQLINNVRLSARSTNCATLAAYDITTQQLNCPI